jgi:hypothetical protein
MEKFVVYGICSTQTALGAGILLALKKCVCSDLIKKKLGKKHVAR